MIKRRALRALILPLAFIAAASLAQPDSADPPQGEAETAPETEQPDDGADNGQERAPARKDSPFVYRPSEEISEDLPVSFPVDI